MDEDEDHVESAEELMLCFVETLAIVLRSEANSKLVLIASKQHIEILLQNFRVYKKNIRVIKTTIMVVRLLLCNEECVNLVTSQFKGIEALL